MQQSETQLIYWAPSRTKFSLTLILAAVVVALGVLQMFGVDPVSALCSPRTTPASEQQQTAPGGSAPAAAGETPAEPNRSGNAWLLIVVGLGVGAYSWLTQARQYRIYPDALVIMYGMPRNRRLPFSQIREIANDRNFMGDPLRVYTANRRRIPIQVHEPDEFFGHLEPALEDFRRRNPEYRPPPEPQTPESAASAPAAADNVVDAPPAADSSAAADTAPAPPPASDAPASDDGTTPSADGSRGRGRRRRRSLRDDGDERNGDDGPPRFS